MRRRLPLALMLVGLAMVLVGLGRICQHQYQFERIKAERRNMPKNTATCTTAELAPYVVLDGTTVKITTPCFDADGTRDYAALLLRPNSDPTGASDVPLLEGASYHPFDATYVEFAEVDYAADFGTPADFSLLMRAVHGVTLRDSDPIPATGGGTLRECGWDACMLADIRVTKIGSEATPGDPTKNRHSYVARVITEGETPNNFSWTMPSGALDVSGTGTAVVSFKLDMPVAKDGNTLFSADGLTELSISVTAKNTSTNCEATDSETTAGNTSLCYYDPETDEIICPAAGGGGGWDRTPAPLGMMPNAGGGGWTDPDGNEYPEGPPPDGGSEPGSGASGGSEPSDSSNSSEFSGDSTASQPSEISEPSGNSNSSTPSAGNGSEPSVPSDESTPSDTSDPSSPSIPSVPSTPSQPSEISEPSESSDESIPSSSTPSVGSDGSNLSQTSAGSELSDGGSEPSLSSNSSSPSQFSDVSEPSLHSEPSFASDPECAIQVSGSSPASGPPGTLVTVTGEGFLEAAGVAPIILFQAGSDGVGVAANVIDDNTIQFVMPGYPLIPGGVAIQVNGSECSNYAPGAYNAFTLTIETSEPSQPSDGSVPEGSEPSGGSDISEPSLPSAASEPSTPSQPSETSVGSEDSTGSSGSEESGGSGEDKPFSRRIRLFGANETELSNPVGIDTPFDPLTSEEQVVVAGEARFYTVVEANG